MANKPASEFPNLIKLGRNWRVEDFFRGLRHPENWVRWITVVAVYALLWEGMTGRGNGMIGWAVAVAVVGVVGSVLLFRLRFAREGTKGNFATVGKIGREGLRRTVPRLARSGKLADGSGGTRPTNSSVVRLRT